MSETADDIRTRALNLLARREHSRRELGDKLSRRGVAADALSAVLDALEGEGLLSDTRFAAAYVESRAGRGFGPVRILEELRQRGVDAARREAACDAGAAEWRERARAARRKRFGEALPGSYRERARQARFLTQRGFSHAQVAAALGSGALEDC